MAPGEGFDEAGDVFAVAHREGGELQPSDPTFRPLLQQRDVFGGQIQPHYVPQESCGFLGREAQFGGAKLSYLAPGAQPCERQGWIYTTRDDELHVGRKVIEQERDDPVYRLLLDYMVVIEDHGKLIR
jgi:hypothetical protein